MKLNLAGLGTFIRLFLLAVGLLFFVTAGLTHFLLQALTGGANPPNSTLPSPDPSAANSASPTASPDPLVSPSPSSDANSSPAVEASPSPSPVPSESPRSLQSYQTKFTKLIPEPIRQAPRADGAEIGRLEIGQEITVLEESPDGAWRKIQAGSSEGWVRTDSLN